MRSLYGNYTLYILNSNDVTILRCQLITFPIYLNGAYHGPWTILSQFKKEWSSGKEMVFLCAFVRGKESLISN